MSYRDWIIHVDSTYLGYLARCVSPTGQVHRTSPEFDSPESALAYGQSMVDSILSYERSRLEAAGAIHPN